MAATAPPPARLRPGDETDLAPPPSCLSSSTNRTEGGGGWRADDPAALLLLLLLLLPTDACFPPAARASSLWRVADKGRVPG